MHAHRHTEPIADTEGEVGRHDGKARLFLLVSWGEDLQFLAARLDYHNTDTSAGFPGADLITSLGLISLDFLHL